MASVQPEQHLATVGAPVAFDGLRYNFGQSGRLQNVFNARTGQSCDWPAPTRPRCRHACDFVRRFAMETCSGSRGDQIRSENFCR